MADIIEIQQTIPNNLMAISPKPPSNKHLPSKPAMKPKFTPRIERLLTIFAEIERQADKKS